MKASLRVGIVGYGTAGQASALLLSADGHRVNVFERAPQLGPVGAGLLLQPVGLAVLWELGLLEGAIGYGARVNRLYGENTAGRPVMDIRYGELDRRLFGLGIQRGALFALLDSAWRESRSVRSNCCIVDIDADAGTLVEANGEAYGGYDLLLIADGAASQLRHRVVPARLDRAYPWGAQWCLLDAEGWKWEDELQQRYVKARRMIGMLPVGSRPDDPARRLSFFWSASVSEMERNAVDKAFDPNSWREAVAQVWPAAAERLTSVDVPSGLATARYRDAVHGRWFRGRAALIGDAAHAMSPQLGQGVNMALLDARALRDALRHSARLPEALARYQAERSRHVDIYHFWSRWLTPVFQSDRDLAATLRDLCFHPLSRLPIGRGQMLRVLTGTRSGWLGTVPLPAEFLRELEAHAVGALARG